MPCAVVVTYYKVEEGQPPIVVVGPFDTRELAETELRDNGWQNRGSKWLNAGMWAFVCSLNQDPEAIKSLVTTIVCKPRA